MSISLKQVNKILLCITIAALFFRKGNFYNSFIPKPFEMLFVIICIATVVYLLTQRKIKDFFLSIPRKIWIAVVCMVGSVLIGWVFAIVIKGIPTNFNMVLEFGTFGIGLTTFLLILFYTKDDEVYGRYFLYALLVPAVYIIFVIFPSIVPASFLVPDGNFLGLSTNVNTTSKMLLVPAIFFISASLVEQKNKLLKLVFVFVATALVGLLFWISSRGALLSLAFGIACVWLVYSLHQFSWKKMCIGAGIATLIVCLGFALAPHQRKLVAVNRILNTDSNQSSIKELQDKSIASIVKDSIHKNSSLPERSSLLPIMESAPVPVRFSETRLEIWPYYIRLLINNPFGFGPNTHMESHVINKNGEYVSSGTHNTYLQIWLWGGILGLFSFLYIVFSAFYSLYIKLRDSMNITNLALLGILFTLSISIMFDDSLSLYCFWIVLALSLKRYIWQR